MRSTNWQRPLPELLDQIKDRLTGDYSLSAYDAAVITEERETALFYEAASYDTIASSLPTG